MRFFPTLAGMLLLSTAAIAQPAPDQGPPPDEAPPGMAQGPGPGMQPPPPGTPGQPGLAPHRMNWKAKFQAANLTHDGRLTREQAQAGGMRGIAVHFDQIDADHKGYVTMQDIRAWRHMRQARKAAEQAPLPPGSPPPAPPQ